MDKNILIELIKAVKDYKIFLNKNGIDEGEDDILYMLINYIEDLKSYL